MVLTALELLSRLSFSFRLLGWAFREVMQRVSAPQRMSGRRAGMEARLVKRKMVAPALFALCLASPAGVAQSQGVIEEVVVTAQKREQRLQDVSIAVTAVSGDRLDALGIVQPIDIQAFVPNFTMKNEVGKTTPTLTIRGVGVGAFSNNAQSPVGVYVDEVFLPSTAQMSFAVHDIERVEVLKGPQGTLFGRNTTAGAVSFVSRLPSDQFEASITLNRGNYDSTRVNAYLSGPLAERLLGRLAVTAVRQAKGFYFSRVSGRRTGETDLMGVRGSLVWDFAESATLTLRLNLGRDNSENHPWVAIGTADPNLPVANPHFPGGRVYSSDCAPLGATPIRYFQENCVTRNGYRDSVLDPFEGDWSWHADLEADARGAVAKLDVDFNRWTLTTVTGYNGLQKTTEEDFDGSPFVLGDIRYRSEIDVFSQEVRIASNDPLVGTIDWMAGTFYHRDEHDENDLYGYADRTNHDVRLAYRQETTSLGVFVHTETRLASRWSLIAGLRYTDDSIDFVGETTVENVQPGGPQPIFGPYTFISLFGEFGTHANPDAVSVVDDGIDSEELTYRIGLDFRPVDNWLLYASYSHGYKSGGFVGFWATSSEEYGPFESETLAAVEVGFKGTLSGGTMALNASLFRYDFKDAQIFGFTPTSAFTILNAGEGDFFGGELELEWSLSDALRFIAGLGYVDAALKIGDDASVRPGNTPEISFNGMLRYDAALWDDLRLRLQTDASYQDDVYFDATERAAVAQGAYWLFNARLALSRESGAWEVAAWVRNLADETYFTQLFRSGTAAALSGLVGNPRTFGVEVSYRF